MSETKDSTDKPIPPQIIDLVKKEIDGKVKFVVPRDLKGKFLTRDIEDGLSTGKIIDVKI